MNQHLADLYSKVQRLLAWFPITGSSIASSTWATTSDITNAGGTEAAGSATTIPRGDHKHALDFGSPVSVGAANADGTGTNAARSDHVHTIGANVITAAMLNSTLYNTGTYSPTIAGTSTPGSNTYTADTSGKYWQIGSMMVVIFHVQMASKDAAMAGNIYVTMPATMASSLPVSGAFPTLFDNVDFAAGYTQFSYYMSAGTNRLNLAQQGDNIAAANVGVAAVTTSSVLRGCAIFPV